MYGFTTQSGTRYIVKDGRISREGDDIVNRPGVIHRAPVIIPAAPKVGQRFRFRLKADRDWVTTSPVDLITTGAATRPLR